MNLKSWGIDEFVSYKLEEDGDDFRIIIKGNTKYKWLIVQKIEENNISEEDLTGKGFCRM
jgi:hypothetical protein